MSSAWVARLPLSEAVAAARLRTESSVRAAAADAHLWIDAGSAIDAGTLQKQLPEASIFQVRPDRQLVPSGRLVPTARLPELNWRPLSEIIPLNLPVAMHAGRVASRTEVSLVPSSIEQSPNVLMLPFEAWAAYALSAPLVRLDRWRFAVSTSGNVVIRGEPLPPLPGQLFVEESGVACPVGLKWSPPVDAEVLRELIGCQMNDLAIMRRSRSDSLMAHQTDGQRSSVDYESPRPDAVSITFIAARDFVKATRSAIRASRVER